MTGLLKLQLSQFCKPCMLLHTAAVGVHKGLMYVQALLCSCSTMGTSRSHDSTLLSLYMCGCVGRSSQPVASSVASNKAQAPLCHLRATPCETLALPLPLSGPQRGLIPWLTLALALAPGEEPQ